ADPLGQIFSNYGFAWFGGLIAGIAAFMYLGHRYRLPLLLTFDVASPAAALAYGIGRIGCLLSGDGDYGIPTSLPWGMSFPNGVVPTTERVHPTPIYEFLAWMLIALILWKLGSGAIEKGEPTGGRIFCYYLLLTGIVRFWVEIIRINPRSLLGMSNAQTASVASVILGVVLLISLRRGSARKAG